MVEILKGLPPAVARYIERRTFPGPWTIEGVRRRDYAAAVVIPALAEEHSLPATLTSLAANPPPELARFLILVVINHRPDAPAAVQRENLRLLGRLRTGTDHWPGLEFAWIDMATPGREMPPGEGVGLARKIGADLALGRLDFTGCSPLLVFLDADTLVRPNYFFALQDHFRKARAGGAVCPFQHQRGGSAAQQAAIVRYELYQRSYVLGLSLAGSPYAYHTVGSTIACRAEAYVRAGGMNRRCAGEDFYFLQQLAKTGGVASLGGTIVEPSARASERTPFGTGPAVARLLRGEEAVSCYPVAAFRILKGFLALVAGVGDASAESVLSRAQDISPELAHYLVAAGFPLAWRRLLANYGRSGQFSPAFHTWFDALRTFRLLRRLDAGPCPRCPAEAAIPPLLVWAGIDPPSTPEEQLEILRRLQNKC